jgi:hypothetical protein
MNISFKKIINLKLVATLAFLAAPTAKASFFTMGDLRDLDIERNIKRAQHAAEAVKDISFAPRQSLSEDHSSEDSFSGEGHKLGGSKYANRLLGITEKEGRAFAKKHRHEIKKRKQNRRYRNHHSAD